MGENKHIKELDAFAQKYVKEIKQEKISANFTTNLMHKIVAESKQTVYKTQPLITKKSWFLISGFIIMSFGYLFTNPSKNKFTFPDFNFSFVDKFQLVNLFPSFSISQTTVTIFILFGCLFFVQILFLKNYFEKQF